MNYNSLGDSGLKVSRVGLGGMTFGEHVSFEDTKKCIKFAVNCGVNLIDTADCYSGGESEKFIGRSIKSIPRGDLVLASKCFFPMSEVPSNRGLSRKHIFDSVHKSLKNLGVDYLDIFQFHRYDSETPIIESISAINDLIQQGKILYWGLSRFDVREIEEISMIISGDMKWHMPISNQWFCNLLSPGPGRELMDCMLKNHISFISYSPIARGLFAEKFTKDPISILNLTMKEFERKRDILNSLANKLNLSLRRLALAWVLNNPRIASTLIGVSNINQLKENIEVSGNRLTEEAINLISNTINQMDLNRENY